MVFVLNDGSDDHTNRKTWSFILNISCSISQCAEVRVL